MHLGNRIMLLRYIVVLYLHIRAVALYPSLTEKSWTYELISVDSNSSDENIIKYSWNIERISRGVFSISGQLSMNLDVTEDDDNKIELLIYRSKSGMNDFKLTPFHTPRQHFFKFMNSFYKDVLMETFSKCSDMPVFTDEFIPPFVKKTYTLDKCQFNTDNLPQHLQSGIYKLNIVGYGTVDWTLSVIVQTNSIFEQTGSIGDVKTQAHARTASSVERIAAVRDSVAEEPSNSTRRRAQQLHVSRSSLINNMLALTHLQGAIDTSFSDNHSWIFVRPNEAILLIDESTEVKMCLIIEDNFHGKFFIHYCHFLPPFWPLTTFAMIKRLAKLV